MFSGRFVASGEAVSLLEKRIQLGSLPHALLLIGESGSGKTTLAKLLAQAAVCTGEHKPCFECSACKKAENGSHPDIFFTDAACGGFSKENFRDLREEFYIVPNEAAGKVFIIENVGKLHPFVANALLKVLEDPPQRILFILTAESGAQVLPTIRSRAVRVALPLPSPEQAAPEVGRLTGADGQTAFSAATLAGGNIGKAVRWIKDPGYKADMLLVHDILSAVRDDNEFDVIRLLLTLAKRKREQISAFLDLLCEQVACALNSRNGGSGGFGVPEGFATAVSTERMLAVCDAADRTKQFLGANCSVDPVLVMLGASACGSSGLIFERK